MRVLFFAQIKDATECDSTELDFPSPPGTEELWAALLKKYPALASHQKTARLARNWEYAEADAQFANTDEVALIPPVSGG